jgi:ubiquinone biosynthesis protein UbiJ
MGGPDAILGLGVLATICVMVTTVARVVIERSGRRAPPRELAEMHEEIEQLRAEHDQLQARLGEIDELHNRVDFAERMLAQVKEKSALPGGPA